MSDTNLAQIPNALFENAVTTAGTGLTKSGQTIALNKASSSAIGGIIPPDGYTINATTGKLEQKPFELIEKIILGYEITTEQPTEGWYAGETLVEQDLSDTTFTPVSGTYYKHTGNTTVLLSSAVYQYLKNAIYYYNGTKYIAYYTKNDAATYIYTPITSQQTWEEDKYYSFQDTPSIALIRRNTEPDGTAYNFNNLIIKGFCKAYSSYWTLNGTELRFAISNESTYNDGDILFMNSCVYTAQLCSFMGMFTRVGDFTIGEWSSTINNPMWWARGTNNISHIYKSVSPAIKSFKLEIYQSNTFYVPGMSAFYIYGQRI